MFKTHEGINLSLNWHCTHNYLPTENLMFFSVGKLVKYNIILEFAHQSLSKA